MRPAIADLSRRSRLQAICPGPALDGSGLGVTLKHRFRRGGRRHFPVGAVISRGLSWPACRTSGVGLGQTPACCANGARARRIRTPQVLTHDRDHGVS